MGEYLPQPIEKKSPTGASTDGASSSSQYILRIESLQSPVGVIQICCIAPALFISARVKVWPGPITTNGLTFQPRPRSRAATEAEPEVAIPPFPFSPVGFSGLMEYVFAFDNLYTLPMPFP